MLYIVSLFILLLDQASKMYVMSTMIQGQSIPVIENVFHITYIHNPGAAFSLLAYRTTFFITVTLLVIAGILIFYWKRGVKSGPLPVALGLIAGGALGNLVDRVRFGEVVDFLDFRVWPIFNLADSAIVAGAGLLVIVLWRMEKKA
ncbi:MAG: signal peptidase II [Peptococcaceae bacterium]|nr:signal peptidase II [Peptococcaceae bacterium]